MVLDVGGVVLDGGVVAPDPLSLPPHPAASTAAPIAPIKRILDFMVYFLIQSLALVGEPATGVFKYGNEVR